MTNHDKWTVHDVYTLIGQISYYTSVEPEYMDGAMRYFNEKYHADIMARMKQDIAA